MVIHVHGHHCFILKMNMFWRNICSVLNWNMYYRKFLKFTYQFNCWFSNFLYKYNLWQNFHILIFPDATFDRQAYWSHIGYQWRHSVAYWLILEPLHNHQKGILWLFPVNHAFHCSLVWTVWQRETQPRAATPYKLTNERWKQISF